MAYQIKEGVLFGALMICLMSSFPDHLIVIGGLLRVGMLALDDFSRTAFLQAMLDDTIKQTTSEPVTYVIEPECRCKWLVWRQAQFMRPVPHNDRQG
jgi:hypothetical protein